MVSFRKFNVAVTFIDKRGEEWYQDFLLKLFCLTVPKNLVGEPFFDVFQKTPGNEKAFD